MVVPDAFAVVLVSKPLSSDEFAEGNICIETKALIAEQVTRVH